MLQLLASVVAEDPSKQAWLLSAGILPVMERLTLHADAVLEPQAFVARYSSAGSGSADSSKGAPGGTSSSSGSSGSAGDGGGSSSGLSLSARIGQSFWSWKGKGSSSGSGSSGAAAAVGEADTTSTGGAAPDTHRDAAPQTCHDQLAAPAAAPAAEALNSQQQHGELDTASEDAPCQQLSSLLLQGLLDELDFGSSVTMYSNPAGAAAVASISSRFADAVQSRFTAAALASPRGAQPDDAAAGDTRGASAGHKQQQSGMGSAALLMEFAQGAAGCTEVEPNGRRASRQNGSRASLAGPPVPQALADDAAAITAAAEEGASWGDGDGLTLLCLQRQVARILSMLALQPAAAQQLTEAAQQLPGGAAELLQGVYQQAAVSRHLQDRTSGAVNLSGLLHAALASGSGTGSKTEPHKQAVVAADASAAVAATAAWLPWLLEAAASEDCLLSSYATKALLHLESAVAYSGSRRRQQHQSLLHQLQQGQGGDGANSSAAGAAGSTSNSSSSSTWSQRLYQELRSSEELAQFMEGLWPFGGSANSTDSPAWRPPVYYPDGVHLMHPPDSHNWGLLQPPPMSLIDSLTAAAASAASAAAAAAASDLAQSDIDAEELPALETPGATVAAAATAVANAAAAAAAAAAASALGADTSQLPSDQAADGAVDAAAARDVGSLQPVVTWLAQKLVKFAAIKEEEVQQAMQATAAAAASSPTNPAAPLSTFEALQALFSSEGATHSGAGVPAATVTAQGQQGEQEQVEEIMAQPLPPEVDIVFIHGIRGGPFVSWRKGLQPALAASTHAAGSVAAAMAAGGSSTGSSKKRKGVALKPSSAAAVHSRHMTQDECWPAAWLAADMPNARLLTVEYKVRQASCDL